MEIITLTKDNLEKEHICCAISNSKDCQVASKKGWLSKRLEEGLVFKKCNVRGKCFVEYIPAEYAWAPIEAEGFMYINCIWVSGQFKGKGNANLLMQECMDDSRAKGKKGLVILSSKKNMPYLCEPGFLKYKGFLTADTAAPFYELLYLPFEEDTKKPQFKEYVRLPRIKEQGFVLYYADQCPFTAKYVPLLEAAAQQNQVPFRSIHFETAAEAQNAPAPFTSFSLFYNGQFVSNEILSVSKFEKILKEKNLIS